MATMGGVNIPEYAAFEEDREEPDSEFLRKLEGNTNINSQWVLAGRGRMFNDVGSGNKNLPSYIQTEKKKIVISDRDDVVMVPLLEQKVSAGVGQEGIGQYTSDVTIPILDRIITPYPKHLIRVVEVRGDSMKGVDLFDGDYVIFAQGEVRADGLYVISIGLDLFVKRLEFDPYAKKITVISENEHYERKVVDADSNVIRIEGKVIGWIHKHPY